MRGSRPPWAWRLFIALVVGSLRRVLLWRVRVDRPRVLPTPGHPLVVVINHTSNVDAFLVADTVWRRLRRWVQPLVKAEIFDVTLLGPLAHAAGAIPVGRGEDAAREVAYGDAIARLRDGAAVLLAPESTITHDGSLLPLRHGAARLALDADAEVLVVTHFGAQRGFSPVVRRPERAVLVTMAMDVIRPEPDEDATALTGRIAATMMDRSDELRATYPHQQPDAAWWPPYREPGPPTATARDNLERYRQSMADAVAAARERMSRLTGEHEGEDRLAQARARAKALAEEFAQRSRDAAEHLAEQTRERATEIGEQARELGEHARDRATELTEQARDRVEGLAEDARGRTSTRTTDTDDG